MPEDADLADPRKYVRLAALLRRGIRDGTLCPGDHGRASPSWLPSRMDGRGRPARRHSGCWKTKDSCSLCPAWATSSPTRQAREQAAASGRRYYTWPSCFMPVARSG